MEKVTFESVIVKELNERQEKYEAEAQKMITSYAVSQKALAITLDQMLASDEYKEMKDIETAIIGRIHKLSQMNASLELDEVKKEFPAEWDALSEEFDKAYLENPGNAVANAIKSVDEFEATIIKESLALDIQIIEMAIETHKNEIEILKTMKDFCKNPERSAEWIEYYADDYIKKVQDHYSELKAVLKVYTHTTKSLEKKYIDAVKAFLDKFVG